MLNFLKQKPLTKSRVTLGPLIQTQFTAAGTSVDLVSHKDDAVMGGFIRGDRTMCPMLVAELELLVKIVKPGDCYVDIGANIGVTSVPLLKSKPGLECVCFEPDAVNYSLLTLNSVINGVSGRMTGLNVALGKTPEYIRMYKSPDNFGDHRSHMPRGVSLGETAFTASPHMVWKDNPATALKAVGVSQIDVAKIDTQGADAEILAELIPLLHPGSVVLFELSPYHLATHGTTLDELRKILERFGRIQRMNDITKPERLEDADVPWLADYYATGTESYMGYIDLMLTL